MADTLFLTFSVLTVACAALVVLNKNAVNAALFLLVTIVGMAGLFVLLDAGLLAVILMFVYGGAVVALFLFIIMLLDTRPGAQKPFKKLTLAASLIGAALLGVGIWSFFGRAVLPIAPEKVPVPTLKQYAELLFTTYLLPVQVVGF
ncbi:MAG TPA: NADH-quinone oxidoreductase subunit J, partial [Candidatus Didemnitutus sp.]|nr:NADH-quinone oxidoreductase subunit J [Candidatus Didemnitutus sp.]